MMRTSLLLTCIFSLVAFSSAAPSSVQIEATGVRELTLRGKDARQQLLVTAKLDDGAQRDFTHNASYTALPAGVVNVDSHGVVTPLADGTAMVTASVDGVAASLPVKVEKAGAVEPINFPNQIVPIFTKASCNSGGCHGKASGQNGFKLSLLGFEPTEDHEHLVKEARGRRIFPAAPPSRDARSPRSARSRGARV